MGVDADKCEVFLQVNMMQGDTMDVWFSPFLRMGVGEIKANWQPWKSIH